MSTQQPAPADRIDLHQALTDPENQPNQYGVEFGMSGPHMHFKIGNQLFKLAYEPDEQEDFDFMKRMLVNVFTTFTHDVKTAPQPSPTAQAAESVPAVDGALEVADAMADSQYLAGVSAGWNAANADDPNAALQKLHESRAGYLKPLSAARKQGANHDN